MINSLDAVQDSHEELWRKSLDIIRENVNPRSFQTWFSPLKAVEISEESITLSDLPGYRIIFTFTNDVYTWKQLEVWTISENILYLLVHQVDQASYESFTSDIEHMIASFSITVT